MKKQLLVEQNITGLLKRLVKESIVDIAFILGYIVAYFKLKNHANPFDPGSHSAKSWDKGYDQGSNEAHPVEDPMHESWRNDSHGSEMARLQLRSIMANAQKLHDMLHDQDHIPDWVESKITLADDYILTVGDFLSYSDDTRTTPPTAAADSSNTIMEKVEPTDRALWGRAKAWAKNKYDVYPSHYANLGAAGWYKRHGGKWRTVKK